MRNELLRQQRLLLRARRRALAPAWRRASSLRISRAVASSELFWRARSIAMYLGTEGEPELDDLLARAQAAGKQCYLPALRPNRKLHFVHWRSGEPLVINRVGIEEPRFDPRRLLAPWALDLVLVPLVGFDLCGNRLGMGGGYYDRSFAFRLRQPGRKPTLLGVGWQCQQIDAAPDRAWDVPLDGVVTERGIRHFAVRRKPVPSP